MIIKKSNKVENEGQKHNREKIVMIINEWRVINVSSRGQLNPARAGSKGTTATGRV